MHFNTKHLNKYEKCLRSNNNFNSEVIFLNTWIKSTQIGRERKYGNKEKDKDKLENTIVNDMELVKKMSRTWLMALFWFLTKYFLLTKYITWLSLS